MRCWALDDGAKCSALYWPSPKSVPALDPEKRSFNLKVMPSVRTSAYTSRVLSQANTNQRASPCRNPYPTPNLNVLEQVGRLVCTFTSMWRTRLRVDPTIVQAASHAAAAARLRSCLTACWTAPVRSAVNVSTQRNILLLATKRGVRAVGGV